MKTFISKLFFTLSLMLVASISFADPVWIDVRTEEENLQDNIEGDYNIPMDTIEPDALAQLFGKDAEINLYCRSGNRAGRVMEQLSEAGFTNVNNVGGIDDVRKLREAALSSSSI